MEVILMKSNRNRAISYFLALLMVLGLVPLGGLGTTVQAAESSGYTDVPPDHWASDVIGKWSTEAYGVLQGNGDGTFAPSRSITLGELATVLTKTFGYTRRTAAEVTPQWADEAVEKAIAAGVIEKAAVIDASVVVTREQAVRYIAIAYGIAPLAGKTEFVDDAQIGKDYKPYIAAFAKLGYVQGKGESVFDPKGNYTRAEAMTVIDNTTSEITDKSIEGKTFSKSLIIRKKGVTLKDTVINGDLIIAQGVGDGEVKLDNVTVKGNTLVYGGGKNSIYLNNFNCEGGLIVRKDEGSDTVRIVVSGASKFGAIILETGAIIVTQQLADGTLIKVEIPANYLAGSTFEFTGPFDEIVNKGSETKIKINGPVRKLTLDGSAVVTGSGKISTADVSDEAGKGTSFTTRPTNITGDGKADVKIVSSGGGGGGGGTPSTPKPTTPLPVPDLQVESVAPVTESVAHNGTFTLPATVEAKLSDDTTKTFDVAWTPASADTSNCGVFDFTGTLTMVSGYVNPNGVKAMLKLTVTPTLTEIEVTQQPAKLNYLVGDDIDLTGIIIKASYSDGTSKELAATEFEVSGFDSTASDALQLTVTYGGETATFNVKIFAAATGELKSVGTLSAITVKNGAAKSIAGLNLPQYVEILVTTAPDVDLSTLAEVTWDISSFGAYDPDVKSATALSITGTITLPDGVGNNDSVSLNVTINVTVSAAIWTVSYDLNGQSGASILPVEVDHGGTIATAPVPTSVSHTFNGWNTAADGTGDLWVFGDSGTEVENDTTLYAIWEIKKYTVTFAKGTDMPTFADITALIVNHGTAATAPTAPSVDGHTFNGWFTDTACTTPYDWATAVTANVALYAKFTDALTAAKEALTWDVIKGTNPNEQSITTNLALVTELSDYSGITITWASNNTAIATNGTVTRPNSTESDVLVTLTATLSTGSDATTKIFELLVRKQGIDNVNVINADALFASGYPMVKIDSTGRLEITAKLKDVPTQAYECYIVVDSMNADNHSPSVQDVIHGHTGNGGKDGESGIVWMNEAHHLVLDSADAVSVTTDGTIVTSSSDVKVGFVLVDASYRSTEVTLIHITPESASTADTTPPNIDTIFVNAAGTKVFVYMNESLDTTSVPAATAFILSSGTVTEVRVVNETTSDTIRFAWIELTTEDVAPEDTLSYTPGSNPIKDTAGNAAYAFDGQSIRSAVMAVKSSYINPKAGMMTINFAPGVRLIDGATFTKEQFSLTNDVALVLITKLTCSYSMDHSEAVITFEPITNPGDLHWDFDGTNSIDAAKDIAKSFSNQTFEAANVIDGNPFTSVTANYSSHLLTLNFTDSQFKNNIVALCNFELLIDEVSYRPRHFTSLGSDGTLTIYLEDYLDTLIDKASSVTISYSNSHGASGTHVLNDLAGVPASSFGPITVEQK